MKITWFKTSLALIIGSLCGTAMANGLAINEQSASGLGTAFAGRASSALDASTVFGNPAGMSKLQRREVSGGLALIHAKTDISDSRGIPGTARGDIAPNATIPFGYLVTPLDERWHFGLGVYAPFGVISDYERSFQGAAHGLYSKVHVVTLQPTLSYKVNDRLAVGFGPTINRISGKLTNTLYTRALGAPNDAEVKIKGDDIAYGYNLGVMYELGQNTTLGLTYHSRVKYKLEGDTRVEGLPGPLAGANGKYDAKLDISMPETVDLSVSHRLDDRWTLHGGATWTRWSRLESIEVRNSGAPAMFQTVGEELQWKDTWAYAIGASYQLNPQWVLRSGFALDAAPTRNDHRNVRIPVANRKVLAIGAGWSPTPDLTIDAAYAYLWESEGRVDQAAQNATLPGVGAVPIKPGYSASFQNKAHGLGIQMSYRF